MTPNLTTRRPTLDRAVASATAVVVGWSLAVLVAPSAHADQTYYVPVTKSWVLHGRGYGHGHGMSQYGAEGAASRGLGYRDILAFYYPGTSWARAKSRVRVLISADSTSDLQVRPARGLKVRDLRDGAHWKLPRRSGVDRWRLKPLGGGATGIQFHNARGWHRWHLPDGRRRFGGAAEFRAGGPVTLLVPGGGAVVGRAYRGTLRLVRPYAGATGRDTVNVVSMDSYVQGVVPSEMPTSWRQPALRAQAVAARTYAAWQRAQNPRRYYQICDTTSCQVYGGVGTEQDSSNAAVAATARKILTYGGRPAFTQFSASSGGWTAGGGVAYLPAKKDRYDGFSGNPVHTWSVRVTATALQRAHPEIGRLVDLRVTGRDHHGAWHGRVDQVVLDGTAGRVTLTGDDLRSQYGLRSTWFTIEPTAIIRRWRALGGAASPLGSPTSGEYAVRNGSQQEFQRGRMFWSRDTGARDVRGPVLTAYRHHGGPGSRLGWPVSGTLPVRHSGHKERFQHGRIYSSRATGAHVVYGAILYRWSRRGAASSWFGYPTADVVAVRSGLRGRFQHGVISWNRDTHRYTIRHI